MLIVGIEINGISLIEDNFVVMDVNLQASLEHVVEFLPWMGIGIGFCSLRLGVDCNNEKLSFFMNEFFSKVLVPILLSPFNTYSFSLL